MNSHKSTNSILNLMKRLILLLVFLIPLSTTAQDGAGLDTLSLRTIFDEPYLPGVRPAVSGFAHDDSRIYFSWNDSSYSQRGFYQVSRDGGEVTDYEGQVFNRASYSPDRSKLLYTDDGDLIVANSDGSDDQTILSTQKNISSPQWAPDNRHIALAKDGEIWIADSETAGYRQITSREDDEPGYIVSSWSGDGEYIFALKYDTSDYREIYFPEYVDKFVEPGMSERGQAHLYASKIEVESKETEVLFDGIYSLMNTSVNEGGSLLAVDYTDKAMKERTIEVYDLANGSSETIFEDETDGWIYSARSTMEFAPEGDHIMFTSEQDGWAHVYTVNADGTDLTQHTRGEFEVPYAEWCNPNSVVYASAEADPGKRHIYRLDTESGESTRLTEEPAFRQNFSLSPGKSLLVYQKTWWNDPFDLFQLDLDGSPAETQLTESVPERFHDIEWQQPEYHRIPARDGETELSMRILKPAGFDENEEYPVVVFAHGAGSLQNVYKGWSNNYWREYMFDQYLTQHGYVTVEVDFRHSTGYGRDFREDVTNWMGKYETRDIVDGLDYIDENHGYIDTDRVGIYGGSYGGFMALYALTDKPDRFHAGAALRKVTNWVNYFYANPWYTRPRLGDPEEDKEHYERSSPLTYAEDLERPALLLHGLIDDNVGFQDAMQYADKLIKSGNTDFEMMVYPDERHSFQDPNAWYDEYYRMFHFFEEHVKNR